MGTEKWKHANFISLIKIYLQFAKGWFILVCFSTLLSPILEYIDVVLLKDAVDLLSAKNELSAVIAKLSLWGAAYIGVIILNSIIEQFLGENQNTIISNRINRKIYTQVLKTDFKYFDRTDFYNDYTWTLNNFYSQTFSAAQIVWLLLVSLLTIGTIGTLMISMDWVVVVLVIVNVIFSVIIQNGITKEQYMKTKESLLPRRVLSYIQRVFYVKDYAMGIKTTNVKNLLLQKYDASTNELSNVIKKHRWQITILSILSEAIYYSMKVLTIVYLIIQVYNNNITIGEFTALFYASISLKRQLDKFGNLLTRLKNLNLYTKGIKEFFELPSEIEATKQSEVLNDNPLSLQFEDVSFKYHDDSEYVLKNISFSIKPGEKVAIVGRNGAGKSTIAKLIMHLYNVSSGEIDVDGKKIETIDIDSLRDHIGIAFQESILYAFSVRENVDVYGSNLNNDELANVLSKAGFDGLLKKCDSSFDTSLTRELDEKGIELSGGEEQFLSIARVLTKKFGLLIFDEPSAALDPLKENELSDLIMNKTKDTTVILISHRLSSVKSADKILFVEDGKIVESGSHNDLMSQKGKYYEMFKIQAENYVGE